MQWKQAKTDCLGKELTTEVSVTTKWHYENNGTGMICWNDNGPVTVVSKIHADLPLPTVKH